MGYLVVKALHIVFIASWFAGLFYLPRIFEIGRASCRERVL